MENEEFILIYYTPSKYNGFQRKHIKYFSSFMFLEAYLKKIDKLSKFYIYQRINYHMYPIGKQQSL